jgi:hypothetical protein
MNTEELINIVELKVPFASRFAVTKVLQVAEPIIRADENAKSRVELGEIIETLRAQTQDAVAHATAIGAKSGVDSLNKRISDQLREAIAVRDSVLINLKDKVEALRDDSYQSPDRRAAYEYAIDAVLTLIDGQINEPLV